MSKLYIKLHMNLHGSVSVIKNVFHITYVQNTGAAWSIFSGKTFALGMVSLAVVLAIILYVIIKKPKNRLLLMSLTLLLSGGLGNFLDRVFYGYVVDFFDFRLISFPVFNVADIFVVLGAALLIIYMLFEEKFHNADKTKGRG